MLYPSRDASSHALPSPGPAFDLVTGAFDNISWPRKLAARPKRETVSDLAGDLGCQARQSFLTD